MHSKGILLLCLCWMLGCIGGCTEDKSKGVQKAESERSVSQTSKVVWKGNEEITEAQVASMDKVVDASWTLQSKKGVWKGISPCTVEVHVVLDRSPENQIAMGAAASLNCRGERDDIAVRTLGSLQERRPEEDIHRHLQGMAVEAV